MAAQEKDTASKKDWLSRLLAVLALALSATGFYYTFLRVSDGLLVSISSFSTTTKQDEDVDFTLTIANDGTRDAVFSDVGTNLSGAVMLETPDSVQLSECLPMIIPSKQIRVLEVRISAEMLKRYFSQGKEKMDFFLAYEGSNASGERRIQKSSPIVITVHDGLWFVQSKKIGRGISQPVDVLKGDVGDFFKAHTWSTCTKGH